MTTKIILTSRDVGGSGLGRKATEANVSQLFNIWRDAFVITGLAPTDGGGLVVDIAAGEALIDGYHYRRDNVENVTVNASETDADWYLQLTKTSGLVTGVTWVRVLDADPDGSDDPADSCRMFRVTTGGASITTLTDHRRIKRDIHYGDYAGNDGNNRTIAIGFRPVMVMVKGDAGTQAEIWGVSPIYTLSSSAIGFYVNDSSFAVSASNYLRPQLTATGFMVSTHATEENLNESGRTYRYLAWPL
jgi:hypothetical protein